MAFSLSKCRILLSLLFLIFFCHLCYSIFSHSKKNSCYFCDFCEICYFFCTFLIAVFFTSFLLKLRKELVSKFLLTISILDISVMFNQEVFTGFKKCYHIVSRQSHKYNGLNLEMMLYVHGI